MTTSACMIRQIAAVLFPGTAVMPLLSSTSLVRRLTQGSQFLPREHFYYKLETLYSTFFLLGVLPPNAQELCTSYPCFEANDTYGSTFELPILRPKMQVITFPPAHQGPIFPLNCATVTMTRHSCWATHRLIFLSVQQNFNGSQSCL